MCHRPGTVNQTGSFEMQAKKVGSETTLSRIVEMVAHAQRSRAPIQRIADTVAGYFVPAVILAAIVTFGLWAWLGPVESRLAYALVNAVAVLIIACPYALGLATPMSIMVGVGRGAKEGILIKDAESLETLENVDDLIVDKTGTTALLQQQDVNEVEAATAQANELRGEGSTVILVAVDQQLAGLLAITDPIKESTPAALRSLHEMALQVTMLTGDNEVTAKRVAEQLGIDEFHAGVSPQEKHDHVRRLTAGGATVAMAGDGINDAPALAASNVGIAMGTGTDVAIESAGVTLVKGNLQGIEQAIRLSRATMRNIRQNLSFAFIYNSLGVPIAAGVLDPFFGILLSPMLAAAAMSLSSVSVITNSLRLRNVELRR